MRHRHSGKSIIPTYASSFAYVHSTKFSTTYVHTLSTRTVVCALGDCQLLCISSFSRRRIQQALQTSVAIYMCMIHDCSTHTDYPIILLVQKHGLNTDKPTHSRTSKVAVTAFNACTVVPVPSVVVVVVVAALLRSTFSINASPALYDDLTSGPEAQYKNPMSSARSRHASNSAGVT